METATSERLETNKYQIAIEEEEEEFEQQNKMKSYKRESLLSLASRNKLKLLWTLIGILMLLLNIVQQLTMNNYNIFTNQQQLTRPATTSTDYKKQYQLVLMKNTPVDHCPIESIVNSNDNDDGIPNKYFRTNNRSSARMRLCFGTMGPVIELRHLIDGKQTIGGLDLNPFQFRMLFNYSSVNIEEHIGYIPPPLVMA